MTDPTAVLGVYLRARRDALSPEDAGLPVDEKRRVRGLRRQEVAKLAGISAEYYLRLEQGRDRQPSGQVLTALARALQLDEDATEYLFRLAGQAAPALPSRALRVGQSFTVAQPGGDLTERVTRVLQQWASNPAYVVDRNQDILGVNDLGRELMPFMNRPRANLVEDVVLGALQATGPERDYWDRAATNHIRALRYWADPNDPRLQLLVASLSSRSALFRQVWNSHEARPLRSGIVAVEVQPFGMLNFRWQTFEVPGRTEFLTMLGDPGEPPSAAALDYLRAKLRVEKEIAAVGKPIPPRLEYLDHSVGR